MTLSVGEGLVQGWQTRDAWSKVVEKVLDRWCISSGLEVVRLVPLSDASSIAIGEFAIRRRRRAAAPLVEVVDAPTRAGRSVATDWAADCIGVLIDGREQPGDLVARLSATALPFARTWVMLLGDDFDAQLGRTVAALVGAGFALGALEELSLRANRVRGYAARFDRATAAVAQPAKARGTVAARRVISLASAEGRKEYQLRPVMETVLDFNFPIAGRGWYPAEAHRGVFFRWLGPGCEASVEVPFPGGATVQVDVFICVAAEMQQLEGLKIRIDGEACPYFYDSGVLPRRLRCTLALKTKRTIGEKLLIEFSVPYAVMPQSEIDAGTRRQLSIGVSAIRVAAMREVFSIDPLGMLPHAWSAPAAAGEAARSNTAAGRAVKSIEISGALDRPASELPGEAALSLRLLVRQTAAWRGRKSVVVVEFIRVPGAGIFLDAWKISRPVSRTKAVDLWSDTLAPAGDHPRARLALSAAGLAQLAIRAGAEDRIDVILAICALAAKWSSARLAYRNEGGSLSEADAMWVNRIVRELGVTCEVFLARQRLQPA